MYDLGTIKRMNEERVKEAEKSLNEKIERLEKELEELKRLKGDK